MARVLVVDDHALVRELLADAVAEAGHEVVGQASDGNDALATAERLRPDLVLLDLSMPGFDGLSVARRLRTLVPGTVVLVVTMHADPELLAAASAAGAAGYVLKDAGRDEVVRAIGLVLAGGTAFDDALTDAPTGGGSAADVEPGADLGLTPRELDVLRLVCDGASPGEVAEALVIARKTVGNHLSSIYAKLGVDNRTEAITEALRRGLVLPPT